MFYSFEHKMLCYLNEVFVCFELKIMLWNEKEVCFNNFLTCVPLESPHTTVGYILCAEAHREAVECKTGIHWCYKFRIL